MAVYVIMLKDYENEDRVIYRYADDFFFLKAGRRLARMIIKESNNFVERTTIES